MRNCPYKQQQHKLAEHAIKTMLKSNVAKKMFRNNNSKHTLQLHSNSIRIAT